MVPPLLTCRPGRVGAPRRPHLDDNGYFVDGVEIGGLVIGVKITKQLAVDEPEGRASRSEVATVVHPAASE